MSYRSSSEAQKSCRHSIEEPVSSTASLAPGEKAIRIFGSEYTRISCSDFTGVESMNLSIGNILGRGSFAEVKSAYCHSRKRLMALKIVNKTDAIEDYLSKFLTREIELLRSLVFHPCIIATHSIVETETEVFILMDLAENGTLRNYIKSRDRLPEPEARYLALQIAEGVKFLHSNSIAHRDLKCDNILLGHSMNVKIADFGFAINVSRYQAEASCGSHAYAAPELYYRGTFCYDALKADVWSLGVILFAMVCGKLVFGNGIKRVPCRHVHFPTSIHLTEAFKDLILSMLRNYPRHRLTCDEAASHIWMARGTAVRPAQLRKLSSKYTKDNLCIQLNPDLMSISDSIFFAPEQHSLSASSRHPQPCRPLRFLRKLASRVSSALKPGRNTTEEMDCLV